MAYKFSRRASKYVWLTLPGVASIALTFSWLISIAPSAQQLTRQETEWRREQQAIRDRQKFLAENPVYSDYSQIILQNTRKEQRDLREVLAQWANGGIPKGYKDGQIIRILDENHQCLGYLIAGQGLYLALDNPGLCGASIPDVPALLDGATTL